MLIGLAAAGCDPHYGVGRKAKLDSLPSLSRVDSIIRSVPGVRAVQYSAMELGRRITTHGLEQRPDSAFTFVYTTSANLWASLSFEVDYQQRVSYSQSSSSVFHRTAQEMNQAATLLRDVEMRLDNGRALPGLRHPVTEWCDETRCR